ncbi:hypothetical protein TRFO_31532 [Tritrichomonas foetus]|uniref:PAS domain-containing protein n=1 Tax=Tritrichomonas foetus TaxID=1144522 RepID=A0A1J4JW91_9EUKA|nr:hypothetical protein TRFO_31532 [Tritrichomonas foetus]|eukprot:OHT01557.1 hypothetical protein TRFO_31532 [Tritrichomonas foetus]
MGEGSPMSFINLTSNYLFLANEMLDYSSYRMHDLDDIYNEFQLVTNLMIYIVTSILVIFLIIFFAISCKRSKDLQKLTEQSLLIPKNQVSTVLLNFMSLSEDSSISLLPLQASTDFIINIKIILTLIFIYFFQICLLLIIQLVFRNMAFVVKSTINDASAIPIIQTAYFTLCNFIIDLPSYDKVELLIMSMIDLLSQLDLESPFYSDNTSTVSNTSLSKVSLISLISINFTAIQSTSVFPFPDISLSSLFLIKMREIVFSLKEMSSIHQDKAIHNLSYAYLNLIFENTECFYDFGESLSAFFKLKYGIDVFTFFSILMAFSLVEVFLYIFSRGLIQDINKIVSLLCRLCSLLPDDSPFAQEPEEHEINHKNSRFWKDPPPSNLKHIFEALPIGIILTNKDGNIQKVNQLANEMYNNQAYKFGNIGNLSSELIINSHPRIYSLKQYDGKKLPTDEYGRSLEWESSKCYMVQNITKQINIHNHIQTLMIDINILHQSLIPPSIRALTEKIMILGQFIIVNISLTPDFPDVRFEVFEKNYLKTCERFSMILTSDIKRFDIHTLFSSVSTKGNSRQYIREAYIFVQKMCKLLGGDAKISMISGHKCICEIDDSDKENFWLYSHSFIRASAMFRCCDYGEIVTEWNVLKTIPNSEKNIDRTGTVTLNNREYDYAILSQRLFG